MKKGLLPCHCIKYVLLRKWYNLDVEEGIKGIFVMILKHQYLFHPENCYYVNVFMYSVTIDLQIRIFE
jgi:hypothetical protein